ncbi:MAG: Gfo/Idh/MocA family oxidoreductase [Spirochaetales bacterium]
MDVRRNRLKIGLVGIGGYGGEYAELLMKEAESRGVCFAGAVDPAPEASPCWQDMQEQGIPLFSSLEEFYAHASADLMVISSPIQFHAEQGILAMERGSHVLCEKPLCATVQEATRLLQVRERTGKLYAVGFQWAYDPAFQRLKRDVLAGRLGAPRRLSTLVLWPRDTAYFSRSWAARIRTKDGRWVLDSIANNAAAHFLHAMLHLTGRKEERSARPIQVQAELYRVNAIENFDTAAIRVLTEEGGEICFLASHAVRDKAGPVFRFEFEEGTVFYDDPEVPQSRDTLWFMHRNGTGIDYGKPDHRSLKKLWDVVDAIRGKGSVPCPIESAMNHTICVNGAQESMREIGTFPPERIRRTGNPPIVWVEGLAEALFSCYRKGVLPSDLSIPWARQGFPVPLDSYREFPSFL